MHIPRSVLGTQAKNCPKKQGVLLPLFSTQETILIPSQAKAFDIIRTKYRNHVYVIYSLETPEIYQDPDVIKHDELTLSVA